MKTLTINNWSAGIAPAPRLAGSRADGSPAFPFASAVAIDTFRIPGVASPGLLPSVVSSTTVVDLPRNLVINNSVGWILGEAGNIYKHVLTDDTFTKDHTSSNPEGRGLVLHHDGTAKYLYYRSDTEIGRFDLSSTYDDNYITGLTSQGTTIDAPLQSYIGNLYFVNGAYVGRKVAGGTPETTYLSLPSNYRCKQIIVYGQWLVLVCVVSANDTNDLKLLFWDGIKPDYQEEIDLPALDGTFFTDNNIIYGWLGQTNPLFGYISGRSFVPIRRLSAFTAANKSNDEESLNLRIIKSGAVVKKGNQLFFADRTEAGLFEYGGAYPELPKTLHKPILPSSTSGLVGVLGYYDTGTKLLIGYQIGSSYKFATASTGVQTGAYFTTPVIDMGSRRKKIIHAIRLYHLTHASGNSIAVTAKKDGASSFSALFTSSYAADGAVDEKIYRWGQDSIAREFELQVTFTTTGSDIGLYSIEIDWDWASEA